MSYKDSEISYITIKKPYIEGFVINVILGKTHRFSYFDRIELVPKFVRSV